MRLAPILQAFFTDYLMTQRHASPHTIASYRDCLRLLLTFARQRTGKLPAELDLADLDAVLIGTFLTELESTRGNSAATRNTRLTAIHSLFRYASLRAPEHAGLISRVLAIPAKRTRTDIVSFLTQAEVDALIGAVDTTTWHGRRDQTLLTLAAQTGLRVSELTGLTIADVHLGNRPARVLPRQEPPITVYSADPAHRHDARLLAGRTRRQPRRPPVPHPHRKPAVSRCGRPPAGQVCPEGSTRLPEPGQQDGDAAHPSPQRRYLYCPGGVSYVSSAT